jgi:hypothetical protein
MCHLAYVLFHEIVCHAFQQQETAPPSCSWTEAWMDKLAFELTKKWIDDQTGLAQPWLPIARVAAIQAVNRPHDHRYSADPLLSPELAKRRRWTREAVEKLARAFLENGMATTRGDAQAIVQKFSLVMNAHPERASRAGPLCMTLVKLLYATEFAHESARVAVACLEFVKHRDMNVLAAGLNDFVQRAIDNLG